MLLKNGMDGDIINSSTTADVHLKETVHAHSDDVFMEAPDEVIADGALGDDERTETESVGREGKQTRAMSPRREPHRGVIDCHVNIDMLDPTDENPPSPIDDKSLNNSHSSNEGGYTGNDSGQGKKKRRRRGKNKGGKHHRKYKPYYKLTWSERREADERETKRANLKREEAFKSGHPVAPYNTTQFLMDDHSKNEGISPGLKLEEKTEEVQGMEHRLSKDSSHCSGGSAGDSEEEYYYESTNDEEQFLEKDFSEAYDSIHVERLQKMSKEELVKDYLELEAKLEDMQKRLKVSDSNGVALNNNSGDTANGVSIQSNNGISSNHKLNINSSGDHKEQCQTHMI